RSRTTTGPQLAPADRSLRHLWRQGLPAWPECGANDARGDCGAGGSDDQVAMTAKTRRELGAMSVLAAMTCGAPAVYGQTAAGDSGSRPVILTFSYTGELVHNAGGGARPGTTFAGAAGGEFTLLLRRLVGWHGARIFVFVLGTHGGAPSDLVGDVQGVSNLEAPPPGAVRSEEHTSELQSRFDLVCRLLLEKKNEKTD